MKRAVASFALLAALFMGNGAQSETCEVKLARGSVAVWHGQCKDGMPYGKGLLTRNGKTGKAVVEDRGEDWVRFSLDDDGREDARQIGGRRPDGNAAQRQGKEQGPHASSGGNAHTGEKTGRSAEDADSETPRPSAAARQNYKFREYNATGGGNTDVTDENEPAESENEQAPPASAARRSESPVDGDAATERPTRADPPAVPCKLDVEGNLYDWSGRCTGDGKAYGEGSATAPDGATYTGSAQNGKRHGYGTETTPDGGWFQGQFQNGLAHGWGMFRGSDGKYYKAWFEKGKQVGERTPMDYASIGENEPDNAGKNAVGGAAESDPWKDADGGAQDDVWGSDSEKADPGADGSEGDVPSYVAAMRGVLGVLVPGAAADDEYVAKVGELERREAERVAAARRAAEREAAAVSGRNARERPRERTVRRDAPERRRAAASNRNLETDRARQARRDRQRRSAERRRKSQALLQRNLKIARLQRQLNRDLSSCNSQAASGLRAALETCRNLNCGSVVERLMASCSRQIHNQRVQCRNRSRRDVARFRSRCEARARSAYRRNIGRLMTQRY